ncbi:type I polyketide synthase [Kibdelosporangium aridum]|uniref:type I polyketide synthase n=1 Tax=Kibdelosporangium aridum TaxID=2030 RepID=UPI00406BD8E1
MGCRFPGRVSTPEQLWDLLANGHDAITGFPGDRGWDLAALAGSAALRGGFLTDVAGFDAAFFGISPREALAMDPQQRLLLEVAWEALERAGFDASALSRETGVFVGTNGQDYAHLVHAAGTDAGGHIGTGNAASVLSGRLAYFLGVEGPAVTVDTACSSSLVALHWAAHALRRGECSLALAGGVTVMAAPGAFAEFSRQGGLAADGRCKAFSDNADGTGWSEGAGVLVLERLSDAQSNGHQVLAVLRGSAVNSDGASNGLTAPNGPSQQRVIWQALANADLTPADVDVIEAHGTGTTLGDPIEAQALLATYGLHRDRPVLLGSIKSNLGHTQAAAGVAGVLKAILALRNGLVPATLHVSRPTTAVDWSSGAVELLVEPMAWPDTGRPHRAGVSSFGLSGTNAHVIVEQAPEPEASQPVAEIPCAPVLVSGHTAAALRAQAAKLRDRLTKDPAISRTDLAFATATTRAALDHRAALVTPDLVDGLTAIAEATPAPGVFTGTVTRGGLALVFAGQGAQRPGMGRELSARHPVFAAAFDAALALLDSGKDVPLREVVFAEPGSSAAALLDSTQYTQSALFAFEVALFRLLESWGIRPGYLIGHSVGEIAAAHVSGVLSLPDACRLVAARGTLMQALPESGAMAAVRASEDDVRPVLTDGVTIAAVNGPESVVLAGTEAAVTAAVDRIGRRSRRLRVSHAFHSPLMDPMLDDFRGVAEGLAYRPPRIPIVSTVAGEPVAVDNAEYWVRQVPATVRFADGVQWLAEAGVSTFVEIGPDGSLCGHIDSGAPNRTVVPCSRRDQDEVEALGAALARMHLAGAGPDWAAFYAGTGARHVDLPTYAFQRERFWPQAPEAAPAHDPAEAGFWTAVETADVARLAADLQVEDGALDAVVPALAAWRRRQRQRYITDGLRYRVGWSPISVDAALIGPSLLVAQNDDEWTGAIAAQLAKSSTVDTVLTSATDRGAQAEALRPALQGTADFARVLWLPGADGTGSAATVALVQALGDLGVEAPLWCATRGAVAVDRTDRVPCPEQAAMWGLGMVAALEYPRRWGGLIDLPVEPDVTVAARLCAVLAGAEDQVAVRAAGLYGRRLLPAPVNEDGEPGPLDLAGTVLVAGGTGRVGASVARWLAGQGVPHLLLASRSGPNADGAEELRAELTALGARVTIAACDVTDRAAVDELLAGESLVGVVHAIGGGTDRVIDTIDADNLAEAMVTAEAAKVLHAATAHLELAAFVLCSSITGTVGVLGRAGNAAAHATLDALAGHRRALGLAATSIAWGPWETDAGFGRGVTPLAVDSALSVLRRALADGDATLAVADVDWADFLDLSLLSRQASLFADLPQARSAVAAAEADRADAVTVAAALRDKLAGLPEARRGEAVLDAVRTVTASVLRHADSATIEPERPFRDLGIDSLTAVELRNGLGALTGLNLPATLVFDYPTPAVLTAHVLAELVGREESAIVPATVRAIADDPVAIVAMACRLPGGVRSPEDLWELLTEGRDAVTSFPADRGWDLDMLANDRGEFGGSRTREGGFLDDAAGFDAAFFEISPREALAMDPQQRLLLEVTWESLERAGIDPASLRGRDTGVFVGTSGQDYAGVAAHAGQEVLGFLNSGNSASVLSGRLSYTLGLEGPAVTVDTACSSSLVSLHLAAQALRAGECDLALAGGVMVMSTPAGFIEFSEQGAMAADGRCKSFSDSADGVGWSEGVGMLVLERLSDARRNGHEVLAVIRGSAINQDGASNGLTAPNGPSQQRVIRQALSSAGLRPSDVDVVEAHGTGTTLGDPIEAQALLATYGQDRDRPLLLGSIKSNIGHSQAAAGVAGVIKMVLSMRHGVVPRSLHVDRPSSHVNWSAGSVELVTDAVDWPAVDRPWRAGVSSFGVSGTNAHVIIEQAAAAPEPVDAEPVAVLPWVLSAKTPQALREQAARLLSHVDDNPGHSGVNIAYSLATARSVFAHRAVVVAGSKDEARAGLAALAEGATGVAVFEGVARNRPKVAFLFAGQGAQRVGMGLALYDRFPVFAAAFDEVCAVLDGELGRSLRQVVASGTELDHTQFAQPALFAVEVALFRLVESWGVRPDVLVGHSVGEIAAACVSGVLSLVDACRLVVWRGRLMQALPSGGVMMAISAAEAEVLPLLGDEVSIAAVNGPESVVLSGPESAVSAVAARLTGRRRKQLRVSHAFHSALMEPMLGELRDVLAGMSFSAARIPIVSTVSGVVSPMDTVDYWVGQIRATVRFADAMRGAAEQGATVFVEIGPDGSLSTSAQQNTDSTVVPLLRRDRAEETAIVTALARLIVAGLPCEWSSFFTHAGARRVDLPTYPFQHQRYWPRSIQTAGDLTAAGLRAPGHPLLGAAVDLPDSDGHLFTSSLSVRTHPWLADHAVSGAVVVPGAAFLDLAVRAGDEAGYARVDELTLETPLVLPPKGRVHVQVVVGPPGHDGARPMSVYSRPETADQAWVRHASGLLAVDPADTAVFDAGAWPPRDALPISLDGFYAGLADNGFGYGPVFRGLTAVWQRGDETFAEVVLPDDTDAADFGLHPAALDAALHACAFVLPADVGRLPFSWRGVTLHATGSARPACADQPDWSGHGGAGRGRHCRRTGCHSVRVDDAAGAWPRRPGARSDLPHRMAACPGWNHRRRAHCGTRR